MRLYGAKVSQDYIQLPKGRKKLKHRYPASKVYPYYTVCGHVYYSCYRKDK